MKKSVWLLAISIFVYGSAFATDYFPACSVNRPVVSPGEAVTLKAWQVASTVSWMVSSGEMESDGASARWRLPKQTGRHTAAAYLPNSEEACSLVVFVVSGFRTGGRRETGSMFLERGQSEKPGYGLYSYFLLGSPPDHYSRKRVMEAIRAYLRMTPSLAELEQLLDRRELNANQMPVHETPPDKITPQWVVDHYDYARARAILRKIGGSHRKGPYLMSLLKPAGEMIGPSGFMLFQDMSSAPSHLVAAWYEHFLNQAAQERFWKEQKLQSVVLRMRTIIGVLAVGLPEVQEALQQWVRWSKRN